MNNMVNWEAHAVVEKWSEEACDFARKRLYIPKIEPVPSFELRRLVGIAEEFEEAHGNLLLNQGIAHLEDQLIGATTNPNNNTETRLGVGNSATAEAASQTDLQAAAGGANRQFKLMNATYPSRAAQTLTFQSDYTTGEANFIWNEWCIDSGTGSGTTVVAPILNRKVASLGTKTTGTWTLTATVTLS